jgi:hypothetical protein
MTTETDPAEAPETVVIVNNLSEASETTAETASPDETVSADEVAGVVALAETAVALVEGQAALAEQQAAAVIQDAAETIEEVTAQEAEQDRSIEALWQAVENLTLSVTPILASLTTNPEPEALTPPLSSEEETMNPTTEFSTPNDTSEPTSETPTEATAESAPSEEPAPEPGEVRVKRVRWM